MSVLPTAPQRNSPTFADDADAFLSALPAFELQMEALFLAASTGALEGTYDAGTTYDAGQAVEHLGVFYVSLQGSNTGNTPASSPTYWSPALSGFASADDPTITGLLTLEGNSASTARSVAASTIDCSTGHYFYKTVSGGLTWTFSNPPASGLHYVFFLELENGAAGTQNFPASVETEGGEAITLSSGKDLLRFSTRDGGTTWQMRLMDTDTQ